MYISQISGRKILNQKKKCYKQDQNRPLYYAYVTLLFNYQQPLSSANLPQKRREPF